MYDPQQAHYVVVTGIVVKDGKYLIARRPGGKLKMADYASRPKDTGEHWYNVLEDLVRREVLEETGLAIKNVGYLTSMIYIRPDNVPALIVSLYADHDGGEVKLCPALTEHAWVSLDEARNYELIEGIYEELEMLDKLLAGKGAGEWEKRI
ncbi:MAG: NUDIX domain-containing protein [Candidatus Liptonbacteria bacterium]|nr:NUDIX domain-containing protein [Candidatus Liptonbacteria bacterium]